METILSRFDIGRQNIFQPVSKNPFDDSVLFQLSSEVFRGKRLSAQLLELIEGITPAESRFFLLSGGRYIYPEGFDLVPPETILETISHDRACLFRRQIRNSRLTGEPGFHLCAVCLGENISGDEVSAGLVYPAGKPISAEKEKQSYGLISLIKRFYGEFTSSRAVCSFFRKEDAFRYVVKLATGEIIVSLPPSEKTADMDIETVNRQVAENLLPRILTPETTNSDRIVTDSRIRNLNISKCRILDTECLFLSFVIGAHGNRDIDAGNSLPGNFLGDLKEQLTNLQDAASRLALKEGKKIDDRDIISVSTIQSTAKNIDKLVSDFYLCSNHPLTDLNAVTNNQPDPEFYSEIKGDPPVFC